MTSSFHFRLLFVSPNIQNIWNFRSSTVLSFDSVCTLQLTSTKNATHNSKYTVCLLHFLQSDQFLIELLSHCNQRDTKERNKTHHGKRDITLKL